VRKQLSIPYRLSIVFLLLGLVGAASSCKTKQIATTAAPVIKKDTVSAAYNADPYLQKHLATQIAYQTFASRVKVAYNDGDQSQNFTAVVRMRRDSAVWLSLQGPFGIEGARILITKDTIKIINKLSGEYLCQPISYLQRILPIDPDLGLFQQFILGYYLPLRGAETRYMGMEDSLHRIQSGSARIRYQAQLSPQNYTLVKSLLTDLMLGQQMSLTFEGYNEEVGKPFSLERSIDIKQNIKTIKLQLSYTKIRVNEAMAFPFEVDPGMRQVDAIRF
jgi:hypothetical protein